MITTYPDIKSAFGRLILPFAAGYLLSYLFRIVNAVAAPAILADISLSAGQLGLISSAYLLAFAAFQIPLGALLDRYQPHVITARLLWIAGIGAIIFGLGESPMILLLGRALIGLGVSACLMAAFKAFVIRLPEHRLTLANGIQLSAGGLGAIAATTPAAWVMDIIGWRGLFVSLGVLAFLISGLLLWRVPRFEIKAPEQPFSLTTALKETGAIYRTRVFMILIPFAVMSQSAFAAIQGLWAGPWLQQAVGLNQAGISQALLYSSVGMMAGFLGMGQLSAWTRKHGIHPVTVSQIGGWLFLITQWILFHSPEWTGVHWWFAFGFLGTSGTLIFAGLVSFFPLNKSGQVSTSFNLLVFVFSFGLQWGMGWVMDFWTPVNGTYPVAAFQTALGIIMGLQLISGIWLLAMKRTLYRELPDNRPQ